MYKGYNPSGGGGGAAGLPSPGDPEFARLGILNDTIVGAINAETTPAFLSISLRELAFFSDCFFFSIKNHLEKFIFV